MRDPDFLAGRLDIGLLDRKLAAGELSAAPPALATSVARDLPLLAALVAHAKNGGARAAPPELGSAASSNWAQAARREALRRR